MQKPSSLYLVQHHQQLENFQKPDSILFREEMLKWYIWDYQQKECLSVDAEIFYTAALDALQNIKPFEAVISLGVDELNKRLYLAKRTWGKIFLGDTTVLTFSHDNRFENRAFYNLADWLELEADEKLEIRFWQKHRWADFFRQRIKDRANELMKKAAAKRKDADEYEKSALLVLNNLV